MHATYNWSKDLTRLRNYYARMMDKASVPNEVEACRNHINRLLLKHGWNINILGSGFTMPPPSTKQRQPESQPKQEQKVQSEPYRKPRATRRFDARDMNEADRWNIVRLHNQGLTTQQISPRVKASPQYVAKFLTDLGFKLKRGPKKKS